MRVALLVVAVALTVMPAVASSANAAEMTGENEYADQLAAARELGSTEPTATGMRLDLLLTVAGGIATAPVVLVIRPRCRRAPHTKPADALPAPVRIGMEHDEPSIAEYVGVRFDVDSEVELVEIGRR